MFVTDEDWFCTHCLCYTDCIEAVNELFGTHYTTWEKMFPELEENGKNELSSEEYNSQEDDDYDPEMDEILSDDNKSVHSESVSEEHSEDEGSDKSTDGVESTRKGKHQPVLAKLLAAESPPVSPRLGKSKTKKRKKSRENGCESTTRKGKGKERSAEENQTLQGSSSLSVWYQNWHAGGAAVEESDDENYASNRTPRLPFLPPSRPPPVPSIHLLPLRLRGVWGPVSYCVGSCPEAEEEEEVSGGQGRRAGERTCSEKTVEERGRAHDARLELGMKLRGDEVRMLGQVILDDLHAL
eukprot:761369-Hanusia_phi.AAC.7